MSHEDLVKRLRKTSVLDHPMDARHAMDTASLALQHADTRAAEDRALILMLQKALAYWMPSVFDERSAHDAYLLVGYDGKDEVGYWDQCAAAPPDERMAFEELSNIANAKRFDHETFADDTEFADWVQSRARHTLARATAPQASKGDEPIAYEFQHDETGRTTFVDPWQVEQGFAVNNPRWQLIGQVYRHARADAPQAKFECAARKQGSVGGNDPADCDWPLCGCDPKATEVIAALQECDLLKDRPGTRTPIYQIGANAGGGIAWWDVDRDRYEREKKAGFMKTGIVYREAT